MKIDNLMESQTSHKTEKIFFFGMQNVLSEPSVGTVGSKAYNLIRMTAIGLSVPPGFVLATSFCNEYLKNNNQLSNDFEGLIESNMRRLENMTRLTFGGLRRPLLISVRSGAPVSMPGMMDTVLNVGLTNTSLHGLIRMTGNPRLAWDSYRRLIQTYATLVHGCPSDPFDKKIDEYCKKESLQTSDFDSETLKSLTGEFLDIYQKNVGLEFPQKPLEQLMGAVETVFKSWNSPRASEYRKIHHIGDGLGTGVIIQTMVFGNMGSTSGSGVAFTRNPSTGENSLYMDFMFNAQGEDVVSGRVGIQDPDKLRRILPGVYKEIQNTKKILEMEFKDVQDFEFTIQEGRLYILQCRNGKRTNLAALQIAVDLVREGIIDPPKALERIKNLNLKEIEQVNLVLKSGLKPISVGIPASSGVVVGEIVLDPMIAKQKESTGKNLILVRDEISTNDINGINSCSGILTHVGGKTSHAAVIARQMNKVCIVGCKNMSIDLKSGKILIGDIVLNEGDVISLDGNNGKIYGEKLDISVNRPTPLLEEIEKWNNRLQ
ncbi:MAG: pyruvate, phosphate dikinase [Thaumarchaeota archaeon]|nr:pyruvate, phosphate dikinase [Nitrososphaerota archaeon]